jgi:predicted metal-dependent peptidase
MLDLNDPIVSELVKARVKLLLGKPWFGTLATRLELVDASTWCQTAATDGRHFFYNREFIKSLTLPELLFLVGHEVLHVVYDHLGRRNGRDPKLWNMACLAWGTPVLMADGTVQPIQRVLPGDHVASPFGPSRVLGNIFSGIKPTVNFSVGTRNVRATLDHKFATSTGTFEYAAKITRDGGHGYVLNSAGNEGVRSGELWNDVVDGIVVGNGRDVYEHLEFPYAARAHGEQVFAQAVQHAALSLAAASGGSVSRGHLGRRGHHHGADTWKVCAADDYRHEHIFSLARLVGGTRILLHGEEEQLGAAVLPADHWGMGDRASADAIFALSRRQAAARVDLAARYGDSDVAAVAWAAAGGSHGASEGTPRIECARFSFREGSGALQPVFDLVTEAGSFFANGILTHNCDYIINYTLKQEAVGTMPAQGLYDPKYTDEMTAEEVYELLKKNSVTIKMPLDQHLQLGNDDDDQDGEGKGQGQDSVDVTVTGKDGPPKLTEEDLQRIRSEIRSAAIQAAQQVGAGKVPAGVRRMIEALTQPKLDWRTLLDSHVRSSVKDDYTFQRISRRAWDTGMLFPSQDNLETVKLWCAIDASGSMSEEMLRDLLSEVKGIMQTFPDFEIGIMTFDTQIYNVQTFTPSNIHEIEEYPLAGGGGTMFECCWEYFKKEGIIPERFVMFTDGYPGGSWGDEQYCSTLFVIHGTTTIEAPFGVTAYYEEPSKLRSGA